MWDGFGRCRNYTTGWTKDEVRLDSLRGERGLSCPRLPAQLWSLLNPTGYHWSFPGDRADREVDQSLPFIVQFKNDGGLSFAASHPP